MIRSLEGLIQVEDISEDSTQIIVEEEPRVMASAVGLLNASWVEFLSCILVVLISYFLRKCSVSLSKCIVARMYTVLLDLTLGLAPPVLQECWILFWSSCPLVYWRSFHTYCSSQ